MIVTVNGMLTTVLCFFLLCFPFLCSAKDNITWNSSISDHQRETLVSAGGKFELGFFTPNGGSDSRRYVGIWYYKSNPKTVVWVANRENPLVNSDGVFAIAEDGNAKVLDTTNKSFWSTDQAKNLSHINRSLKLLDSGNLVLMEEDDKNSSTVWQSFDLPTDTFLPGMKMDTNLVLISWRSSDDPGLGNFTFQQDQDGQNQYIIRKRETMRKYWQSRVSGDFIDSNDDDMLIALFSGVFTSENNDTRDKRLVMDQSGKIQYYISQNYTAVMWSLDNQDPWDLNWWEPRNRCSLHNACGDFGCCNSRTRLLCKCLPGFQPKSPNEWNSGDFSGGCTRISSICSKDEVGSGEFLSLKMMKVGKPNKDSFKVNSELQCKNDCLRDCNCQAYSYAETKIRGYNNPGLCRTWKDLDNLWENFTGGCDLFIRVATSDIGSRKRTCEPCGTNFIPYPLSTGRNCGDPLYFSFDCNKDIGNLSFNTPKANYSVTRINPETRTFSIQVQDALNCSATDSAGKFLLLNKSLPFNISSGCNEWSDTLFEDSVIKEIDIVWIPPSEPMCSSLKDCTDWPHTTCNVRADGHGKCLCNGDYTWDPFNVTCTSGEVEILSANTFPCTSKCF